MSKVANLLEAPCFSVRVDDYAKINGISSSISEFKILNQICEFTKDQKEFMREKGISSAVNHLISQFNQNPADAIENALKFKEKRKNNWLNSVIKPLAEKHGTTPDVIISVLFNDNHGDITTSDAYSWVECHDFAQELIRERHLATNE